MAQTPESRAIALLQERDAIYARHAARAAEINARATSEMAEANAELDTALARCLAVSLELLTAALQLDERPPEPAKASRLLSREKVNTLLSMLPPDLAHAAKALTTPELAQLLISAKARRLGDHIGAIEREIGGRS